MAGTTTTDPKAGSKDGGKESKPGNRRLSFIRAVAVTAVAGAISLGILAYRGCGGEPTMVEGPRDCPEQVTCPTLPEKGDGRCDVDRGEHDYYSVRWDPESCGFCGDGIQQEWENETNCPVDFHCGNGERDRNKVYGAVVVTQSEGSNIYSLGTKTVSESCRQGSDEYCEDDCAPAGSRRATKRDRPSGRVPSGTTKAPPRASGGPCTEVGSPAASGIARAVRSNIGGQAGALRRQVLADPSSPARVRVAVTVSVDAAGNTSYGGSRLSCSGDDCTSSTGGGPDVSSIVNGRNIGNQGEACTWTIFATVPSSR